MHVFPIVVARGRSSRTLFSVLTGLLLVIAALAALASPARADVPSTPATDPFAAPLCEGTTVSDPSQAEGTVADLTMVFGQRLVDYNAGRMVFLYNSHGENTVDTPVCGVRYVEGHGPVSEWAYCTDFHSLYCNVTDENGNLTQDGDILPPLEDLDTNPRLTADQERLIHYILTTELPMVRDGVAITTGNATQPQRNVRQRAVWCISEPENKPPFLETFCAENLTLAQQQSILDTLPPDPVDDAVLELSGTGTPVLTGQETRVTMLTNIATVPIQLSAPGATVTVCESSVGQAVYRDGELQVTVADGGPVSIDLCVTWPEAGPQVVTAAAEGVRPAVDQLHWVQSPASVDGVPCQVFSSFSSTRSTAVSAALEVIVSVAPAPVPPTMPAPAPTSPAESSGSGSTSETRAARGAASAGALAATGGPVEWGWVVGGGAAVLLGAVLLGLRRAKAISTPRRHAPEVR